MVVHMASVHCRGVRADELSAVHKLTIFDAMIAANVPARLMPRLSAQVSYTVIKELQAQGVTHLKDVEIDDILSVVPTNIRLVQDFAAAVDEQRVSESVSNIRNKAVIGLAITTSYAARAAIPAATVTKAVLDAKKRKAD